MLAAGERSVPGFPAPAKKLPVAAVVSEYRENSHADVIVGKILEGYDQRGGPGPNLEIVSLYTDQVPDEDLSRGLSKKHGFRIVPTIEEAITLGTGKVQVAGVLSIGEHGDYPKTKRTGQKMYPRRRFFDQITATFRKAGSVVPVFNDKHLAYDFNDTRQMYDAARKMKIPFMAGSSIPVTWRRPPLSLPPDCEIESALAIGYSDIEAYGFHALEGLQCMIERRRGGESGVKRVQAVQGEEIWKAELEGRWSRELFDAALKTMPPEDCGQLERDLDPQAPFFLFEHQDGLKSCVAMANGVSRHFGFAAKLKGRKEPVATWYELELDQPFGHFAYLVKAINHMFQTGQPAYPVERTLLTTGMLDEIMHSLADDNRSTTTPHLKIAYQPTDWPFANAPEE
ncbi:MAG: hypothetical protein HUJ26_13140 [Planctomycetaceae bacterium]|nr:hypothetical protein [Planctomycetaceae bacterium]